MELHQGLHKVKRACVHIALRQSQSLTLRMQPEKREGRDKIKLKAEQDANTRAMAWRAVSLTTSALYHSGATYWFTKEAARPKSCCSPLHTLFVRLPEFQRGMGRKRQDGNWQNTWVSVQEGLPRNTQCTVLQGSPWGRQTTRQKRGGRGKPTGAKKETNGKTEKGGPFKGLLLYAHHRDDHSMGLTILPR